MQKDNVFKKRWGGGVVYCEIFYRKMYLALSCTGIILNISF